MITIDVHVKNAMTRQPEIWEMHADDSRKATAIIVELLRLAELVPEPRLLLRVTGDTTAASCRHPVTK